MNFGEGFFSTPCPGRGRNSGKGNLHAEKGASMGGDSRWENIKENRDEVCVKAG